MQRIVSRRTWLSLILLVFFLLPLRAQTGDSFLLTLENLPPGKAVELHSLPWRYKAGDEKEWAAADYDDSDWQSVSNDQINADAAALENWEGRAWFRLKITVDEKLTGQPLALRLWHWGASEVYIDGQKVESFGVINPDGSDEEYNPRGVFIPVVFNRGSKPFHVIAVRQSFSALRDLSTKRSRWLISHGYTPGFKMQIEPVQGAGMRLVQHIRSDFFDYSLIGLLFALGLVHILLYGFYPAARGNLYYGFFVFGLGLTILLNRLYNTGNITAEENLLCDIGRNIAQAFAIDSLLAFLYIEFTGRLSRFFRALTVLWLIAIALLIGQVSLPFPYFLLIIGITLADSLRLIIQSFIKRRSGAWSIAAGVCLLIIGVANNVAFERRAHFLPEWLHEYNLYLAIMSVPIAVSIYLARNFARTNYHLEEQLLQVRQLSDQQLEHERVENELRLSFELTQAENNRRAQELEEARNLQLSMLPKKLPDLPNLEIAAYMKPATEVGGDYYDFQIGSDGTLTIAVGDATGHGLKAGSVVTATKSLFNAFAGDDNIPQVLNQMSGAIKKMNLRGLFMALALLKIKNRGLTLGIAGMPPVLIYREQTKQVETIAIKAMPLGSVARFPHQELKTDVSRGDCVVIMSDGFPEMFNEIGEMIGFDKAAEILPAIAERSAQEIIDRFVSTAQEWAGGRPPDDDVTFVVIKFL